MNTKKLVEETFLAPFAKPGREYVGVELEFPLLNLAKAPVDKQVACGLMTHLLEHGFQTSERDMDGNPAFLVNQDGDELSFDNSYNNFEFAMAKGKNLSCIANRFYRLYALVQNFLLPQGHTLCGMGTNPYQPSIERAQVRYPIYLAIGKFLEQYRSGRYHEFPDFPAYLSSVQTHLDVPLDKLPRALTLFARMDFVRALLFSNSLPFPGIKGMEKTICFRDYLWEKSGFGSLLGNVGKVEGIFRTAEDIMAAIMKKSVFLWEDHGAYELIPPVSLEAYFSSGANPEDIRNYLSFQNVEVTQRGTLEIRSDCTQPVQSAFAPPAFHLGVFHKLEEAEAKMEIYFQNQIPDELVSRPDCNAILRNSVIYEEKVPGGNEAAARLLKELVELAEDGLRERGRGEEEYLAPLAERAEMLTCPAKETRSRLREGEALESIIHTYSSWN